MITYLLLCILPLTFFDGLAIQKPVSLKKDLKKRLIKVAEKNKLPTLSVYIKQGETVTDFYYQNKDKNIRQTQQYGLASTTKMLAAILLLDSIEQGHLKLNDPILNYLDKEELQTIGWVDQITIEHLLSHRSGLPDYTRNPVWIQAVMADSAPQTFKQKIDLLPETADSTHFNTFMYSNTNYVLLQEALERISGQQALALFNEYYQRIGLQSIRFTDDEPNQQAFFAQQKKQISEVTAWKEFYGFEGGAQANRHDAAKLLQKLFVEKKVLDVPLIDAMMQWTPMGDFEMDLQRGKISNYGLGLMKLKVGNQSFYGHAGSSLKFQSVAFINPETEDLFVLQTNASGPFYNKAFLIEALGIVLQTYKN